MWGGGTSEGFGGWSAPKGKSEEKRGLTLEKKKEQPQKIAMTNPERQASNREITQHCLFQWLFCSESSVGFCSLHVSVKNSP